MARATVRTKEESSTPQVYVLHNLKNSPHTIPHPNAAKGIPARCITVPERGYIVLDHDPEEVKIWQRSWSLRRSIDDGYVEMLTYNSLKDIPRPVKLPDTVNLTDPGDKQTLNNILYHSDMSYVNEIIHMKPMTRQNKLDREYLKNNHVRILKAARFMVENGEGHKNILTDLNQRIQEIADM